MLPWDIIDGGMKTSFFQAEFAKSLREEWTLPPKRQQENAQAAPAGDRLVRLASPAQVRQASAARSPRAPRTPDTPAESARAPCSAPSCRTIGRSSAKLRRSPLTLYCRAGNVTLCPPAPPPRRSQMEKPISFKPSSGPSVKCSSASATFPGGFPLSFGVILTVMAALLPMMQPPASGGSWIRRRARTSRRMPARDAPMASP